MIPGSRAEATSPAISASDYPLKACFSAAEAEILQEVLLAGKLLPEDLSRELTATFERSIDGLAHVIKAIESCPSLYTEESIAGRSRSVESLIETLCQTEPLSLDFVLPTRATLGQSFLLAKINFFKAVLYILDSAGEPAKTVFARLNDVLGDAIYFKLSEELLTACASNAANPLRLRQAAARTLIPMWEHRLTAPIEEFRGLLLSGWRARCRVQEVFGTLVGIHEVFSLIRAECEPRFLDFFTREWVTADEREAFREFLFGLSYEDLEKLRRYMEEHKITIVSPEDVGKILGSSVSPPGPTADLTPEAIYLSYRRRRMRADYRVLTGNLGPRKTAEGYLLEYHLLQAGKKGVETSAHLER